VREFRDDQGRPWQVALTVAAALRVKDNVTVEIDGEKKPFDLVDVAAIATTMQVLRGQYTTIAETLYFMLLPQMEPKGVSKEQFLDGMRGDALDEAAKCLEQELVDFFPKRLRELVALLVAKMAGASDELLEQERARLEKATVADLIAQSGLQSGSVPESSASTPGIGPFANSSPPETPASKPIGGTRRKSFAKTST
jgi:hypothetical protein